MALGATGALGDANAEAVLEALVNVLEVPGTAAAGGLSSLGLLTPVDCISKINRKPVAPITNNSYLQTDMYQFRGGQKGVRTLAGLSGGVAAVGTSRLLDVKRAAAC